MRHIKHKISILSPKNCKNCTCIAYVTVYHCMIHMVVSVIFPFILQKVINIRMMADRERIIWGQ